LVDNSFDFNRDGLVNIVDQFIARNNFTNQFVPGNEGLLLITPPVILPLMAPLGSLGMVDGIFAGFGGLGDDDEETLLNGLF
jgi:hypothetical protein